MDGMEDISDDGSYMSEKQPGGKRMKSGEWIPAKQTKRYKESHKQTEKCRRDKINQSIKSLSNIVPTCSSRLSKPDKLTVLSHTVEYIKSLQEEVVASQRTSVDGIMGNSGMSLIGRMEIDWRQIVMDNISDIIFVISLQGKFMHLSASWKAVLGHSVNELLHRSLVDVIHPHDIEYIKCHINQYHKTGIDFVARFRKGNGEYVWLGVRGRPYIAADSKVYLVAIGRPYDGLQMLPKEDEEFVSKHNLDAKWIFVSPNVNAILGFLPDELIGAYPKELQHADQDLDIKLEPGSEADQQVHLVCQLRKKNGGYVWMDLVAWYFMNPGLNTPAFIFCRWKRSDQTRASRTVEPLIYNPSIGRYENTTNKELLAGLIQLKDENKELRHQILQLQLGIETGTGGISQTSTTQQSSAYAPITIPGHGWVEEADLHDGRDNNLGDFKTAVKTPQSQQIIGPGYREPTRFDEDIPVDGFGRSLLNSQMFVNSFPSGSTSGLLPRSGPAHGHSASENNCIPPMTSRVSLPTQYSPNNSINCIDDRTDRVHQVLLDKYYNGNISPHSLEGDNSVYRENAGEDQGTSSMRNGYVRTHRNDIDVSHDNSPITCKPSFSNNIPKASSLNPAVKSNPNWGEDLGGKIGNHLCMCPTNGQASCTQSICPECACGGQGSCGRHGEMLLGNDMDMSRQSISVSPNQSLGAQQGIGLEAPLVGPGEWSGRVNMELGGLRSLSDRDLDGMLMN